MQGERRTSDNSAVCLIGLLCTVLLAQEGGGTLVGTASDPTTAVIPGAVISVVHRGTGLTRSTNTDATGSFVFSSLPVGIFDVTASREGFSTVRSTGVVIAVGSTTRLNIELHVAAVAQDVTVTADVSLLNTESAAAGRLMSSPEITNLPLNGRNFMQLVSLQAGVRVDTAGPGIRPSFVINGAPPQQGVNFLVDGTDGSSIGLAGVGGVRGSAGQSTFTLGLDSISEFMVHTNNYSARYGKALGGVIEAVTKSGTNALHGNVFHYLRNSVLNANSIQANAAGLPRVPQRFNQFGANAGGPIVRNKMFFWIGYEGVRRRTGIANSFTVLSAVGRAQVADPEIATFVNRYLPQPNRPSTSNPNIGLLVRNDVEAVREDIGTVRYDYHLSAKDNLFARYNIHDTSGSTPQLATPINDQVIATRQQLGTISLTHVASPNTTFNFRIGGNRLLNGFVISGPDPGLNLNGLFSISSSSQFNSATAYTYAGDITQVRGRHTLSAGFEYHTTRVNRTQRSAGTYAFLAGPDQLVNFYHNIPDQFSSQSVIGGNSGSSGSVSSYFEDALRASRRLTLNLGLRHDYFFRVTEKYGRMVGVAGSPFPLAQIRFTRPGEQVVPRDLRGYGPRLSLAFSPNSKWVVQAGYGIFVGLNYPSLATAAAFSFVPPLIPVDRFDPNYGLSSIVFRRGDRPNLAFPDVSFVTNEALLQKAPPPSPNLPLPDWKNTYTHQWTVRLEHELLPKTRLAVAYISIRS